MQCGFSLSLKEFITTIWNMEFFCTFLTRYICRDIWYFAAQGVSESVGRLVRNEHMLQVVWKAAESWQRRPCGICCQGESVSAKVKPEWAIQLSSSAQRALTHMRTYGGWQTEPMCTRSTVEERKKKIRKCELEPNNARTILARPDWVWVTPNYSSLWITTTRQTVADSRTLLL